MAFEHISIHINSFWNTSTPWCWKLQIPMKRSWTSTRLHGATTHNTVSHLHSSIFVTWDSYDHRIERSQVEDGGGVLQIRRLVPNILKKRPQTAKRGRSLCLQVGRWLTTRHRKTRYKMFQVFYLLKIKVTEKGKGRIKGRGSKLLKVLNGYMKLKERTTLKIIVIQRRIATDVSLFMHY
jgi:hypothetical protein